MCVCVSVVRLRSSDVEEVGVCAWENGRESGKFVWTFDGEAVGFNLFLYP